MSQDAHPPSRFRFGVFELDARSGQLRKGGTLVRLQEQPFQILTMLVERSGELVSREDLQKRIWAADTFVDFDLGLNKAINKIRDVLGDSAESPRFVETVPRRGYRFLAEVTAVVAAPPTIPEPDAPKPPAASLSPRIVVPVLIVLVAVLGAWAWQVFRPPVIRSLAVLPMESLSGDASQEYFADGMTDELIADLGQLSALRVISRTSVMAYKGVHRPLPAIARELNVDAVVEGTVLRSGDRVRITAQLIRASDDKHLWAQSYEGDLRDTLLLQSQVARAIADQIQIGLTSQDPAAIKRIRTVDSQAYVSFLKGRFFWNKRTADGLRAAVAYFEQAIGEDPSYAQAYSGLADTYALLGDWQYAVMPAKAALPKAKAAAMKALDLDNTLGEAHNSLAFLLDGFDWDFDAAGNEFRKAIALNPNYATGHHWYALHLALVRQNDEAIAEMRRAADLDPLSLIINADLAELLLIANKVDESIQQSRKTIDMDANFALAHHQLAQAYLAKRMNDDAIGEFKKAIQLSGDSPTFSANLARAYVSAGRRADALVLLDKLKNASSPGYSPACEVAVIYAALGDTEQAMAWLERGYQARFNPGVLLRPGFDSLRADPRFQDVLRRVGLRR
jgi:TolB-like protein/DNA-binding winged helix-turn-helix (wHTH) protein/Tfp pilus assembly protein PilF